MNHMFEDLYHLFDQEFMMKGNELFERMITSLARNESLTLMKAKEDD
jgi:hypothetical protein